MDELTHLLRTAADGDRDALSELVAETQVDVFRFCAGIVGRHGADDATQETFLRAWRAAHSFRGESGVRTWLLAIARRACLDQLRKQRRQESRNVEPAAVTSDPGELIGLRALVAGLEPDRRMAFVLTQLHGLSYAEAAEVCDCPIGTIRSRIARARSDLIEACSADGSGAAGSGAARSGAAGSGAAGSGADGSVADDGC